MIDDSEDDILVWDSSASSPHNYSADENHIIVGDEINELEEDVADENPKDQEKELEEPESEITDDSGDSVYGKKYYKISEVESIIGETQSTIRFWEDSFSELGKNFCSHRSRGGTRKYTKENIENLKLLQLLLRERRLTIDGAITEIKSERKRNVRERALILLRETRDELNNLIDAYNYVLHQKC